MRRTVRGKSPNFSVVECAGETSSYRSKRRTRAVEEGSSMILKPRRKNTKSPDGGETLGAVEDGTWEERPTVFEQ